MNENELYKGESFLTSALYDVKATALKVAGKDPPTVTGLMHPWWLEIKLFVSIFTGY